MIIQTIALESEYIPIIEDFDIIFYFKFIFEKFKIDSFEPVSIVEYQLYYVDTDCIVCCYRKTASHSSFLHNQIITNSDLKSKYLFIQDPGCLNKMLHSWSIYKSANLGSYVTVTTRHLSTIHLYPN
jgi:hypothetical protein